MKAIIARLKAGLPKDLGRQFRIRPTTTAREIAIISDAMKIAADRLEEAREIIAGLMQDDAKFGDRERAYDWLTAHRSPAMVRQLEEVGS